MEQWVSKTKRRGLADDVGVFAEGEPHDFYGTGDGTNPPVSPRGSEPPVAPALARE